MNNYKHYICQKPWVEAQIMPNHLKQLSPEGYKTVMKLIQLNGHDHFADDADDAS